MSKDNTPTLTAVGSLRRERDELNKQIAKLIPSAIEEGYAAGLRPEEIALQLGISVSRVHQIRRENRNTVTGSDNAKKESQP